MIWELLHREKRPFTACVSKDIERAAIQNDKQSKLQALKTHINTSRTYSGNTENTQHVV